MASRSTYHHGNLRESALAAFRHAVEQGGHEAITMRDLAGRLQVTPAALYRHFDDRGALLVAAANEAHAELFGLLEQVVADHADPRAALRAALVGFLGFTGRHPGVFRMMYDDEVTHAPDPEAQLPALASTYRLLARMFRRAVPTASAKDVRLGLVALWSTLFGYASVRVQGGLQSYMLKGLTTAQVERNVVEAALRAAGL